MGSPLPVTPDQRDVIDDLADDIRAHLAFLGSRAANGEILIRLPLEGGRPRPWQINGEERCQPGAHRQRREKVFDTTGRTGVDSTIK